jgi:integrase
MVSAIRLLIHTGARSSEIARLKWGEVSVRRLELADSKTGAKTILLSRQAAAILEALPRGADDELVFKGTKGQPANLSYFWSGMRQSAGLPDVRLHDLRHSYASIAIQNGISLDAIGRLLGHALPETTERYAHLTDQNIVDAAESVGESICTLMGWANAAL